MKAKLGVKFLTFAKRLEPTLMTMRGLIREVFSDFGCSNEGKMTPSFD
jgi:hypothetical protein